MLSSFMVFLDTSVVNVSLPYIAGSLSASIDESTWALTSYLAANAVILPLAGWLANHFGRKRLMIWSVLTFTAASLLCGLAPSLPILVAFRVIQGLTGGVMMPLSQSVMLEGFPPHERGRAMGFWSVGIVLAPIMGPVIGGYLTLTYSWRWVFYVNVPVGVLSLIMLQLFVFDPPYIQRRAREDRLPRHRAPLPRHRRAATAARQGAGGGVARLEPDRGLHRGRRGRDRLVRRARAARRRTR